jgi:hypothetical protein
MKYFIAVPSVQQWTAGMVNINLTNSLALHKGEVII